MAVNLTGGNTLLGGRQNEKDVKEKQKTILESLIANSDVFFSRTHKQIAIDDSSDCILVDANGREQFALAARTRLVLQFHLTILKMTFQTP